MDKPNSPYSNIKYSIISNEFDVKNKFKIDSSNGDLYLLNELDYEKQQFYEFKVIAFDNSNSTAKWVNVKKGIKKFTFNTDIGIVNYIDERDVKWKKK